MVYGTTRCYSGDLQSVGKYRKDNQKLVITLSLKKGVFVQMNTVYIYYPWGLDVIVLNRRISVSTIMLTSLSICFVSASDVSKRLRSICTFLMISVKLASPDRGFSKKRFVSLMMLANTGIPLLRSLLTSVLTNSINSSIDLVNLQRSGPSTVASILRSQAGKHSAVI